MLLRNPSHRTRYHTTNRVLIITSQSFWSIRFSKSCRTFSIPGHESGMDIRLLVQSAPCLDPDLLPVVQECMHQRRRDAREAQAVRKLRRSSTRTMGCMLVFVDVQRRVGVQNIRDVVLRTSIVIRGARKDSERVSSYYDFNDRTCQLTA